VTDPVPGRVWNVAKLRPDGSVATRYAARELPAPPGWLALRADWVHRRVDIGYFAFEPGDVLDEYFSTDRYYNAFATFRGDGEFVGWYCNVTYPAIVRDGELDWHDLYVDILVLPDGTIHVLDEDELEESGLSAGDPALHSTILAAREELLQLIRSGSYPFTEVQLSIPSVMRE
jgi:hypothetical protein